MRGEGGGITECVCTGGGVVGEEGGVSARAVEASSQNIEIAVMEQAGLRWV